MTFVQLFSERDIWVVQTFTKCHLATEETLLSRISDGPKRGPLWWVDGGRIEYGWWRPSGGSLRWRKHFDAHGLLHGLTEGWYVTGEVQWREVYVHGTKVSTSTSASTPSRRAVCVPCPVTGRRTVVLFLHVLGACVLALHLGCACVSNSCAVRLK